MEENILYHYVHFDDVRVKGATLHDYINVIHLLDAFPVEPRRCQALVETMVCAGIEAQTKAAPLINLLCYINDNFSIEVFNRTVLSRLMYQTKLVILDDEWKDVPASMTKQILQSIMKISLSVAPASTLSEDLQLAKTSDCVEKNIFGLSYDFLIMEKIVGEGASGTVWQARHYRTGTKYAVKILNSACHASENEIAIHRYV